MTLPSRRNRRIIPSRITVRRIAISLALIASPAAGLAADPPAAAPAPTRWAPIPSTPSLPTPMPAAIPRMPAPGTSVKIPTPPPPAPATPSNIVIFQKPAGTGGTAPATPIARQPEPAARTPVTAAPQQKIPAAQPDPKLPHSIDDPAFSLRPSTVLTREKVFRFTSDAELRERVTRELYEEEVERETKSKEPRKVTQDNYRAPVNPPIAGGIQYQTKVLRYGYPPMQTLTEPHYVVHRRLLFEEKNSDRYGWDAGIIQPFLSAGYFYKDVLLWPAHLASHPFDRYDSSAGKCRPGDPVPYYLYPPQIDLFGGALGAGAIVGTLFLFP